jgi:bifunctional DNA-binding transcriptional regulator/antitoxin component of YhaV-PrlF toxin-antitoxin module
MPQKTRLKMAANGRLVIPLEFRKALGVTAGGELILSWEDDGLRIATIKQNLERAQRHARKYAKPGVSVVDEFIKERREAAKREFE